MSRCVRLLTTHQLWIVGASLVTFAVLTLMTMRRPKNKNSGFEFPRNDQSKPPTRSCIPRKVYMAAFAESYPDLSIEGTQGTQAGALPTFYFAGPYFRPPGRTNWIADPTLRNTVPPFNPKPMNSQTAIPPPTAISLENLTQTNYDQPGFTTTMIKLHYRFVSPEDVQIIMDEQRTVMINPEVVFTAILTTPTALFGAEQPLRGDTKVRISTNTPYHKALSFILEAIREATAMTRDVLKFGRFMYALKAECGMLSERIHELNWKQLRSSLHSSGWWLRVYLMEIEPDPQTGWVTKPPAVAVLPALPQ